MLDVKFITSISSIGKAEWQSVCGTEYPFTRYEFLAALEYSGATTALTGWKINHALVYDGDELVAVMPCYLKFHSYGEFVFDFQWAEAYQRNSLPYYPKLITAIPFSPVTGPRLCIKKNQDSPTVIKQIVSSCMLLVKQHKLSSWHVLFPELAQSMQLESLGLRMRKSVHFHWFNQHYSCFDDFINSFNSRKRKNIRKERQKIIDQGITLKRIEGADISADHWKRFYHFYQLIYAKRSGHGGYLPEHFFSNIGRDMPESMLMVLAYKDGQIIAGALNLKGSNALYGRYWGCYEEYDFLHFETCYYQGIEYCIEKKINLFDPGVQGEHKIQRGFLPVYTYSNHWIEDSRFRDAISNFLLIEEKQMALYKQQTEKLLPFKQQS